MSIIAIAVGVVGFLILCCYAGYICYEYKQSKLLTEKQNTNKVSFEGYTQHAIIIRLKHCFSSFSDDWRYRIMRRQQNRINNYL